MTPASLGSGRPYGHSNLVLLNILNLRAAGLRSLLAQLVGFRCAGEQLVLAVSERDGHPLAARAINHEIGVREPVHSGESVAYAFETLDESIAVASVGADTCVHHSSFVAVAAEYPLAWFLIICGSFEADGVTELPGRQW